MAVKDKNAGTQGNTIGLGISPPRVHIDNRCIADNRVGNLSARVSTGGFLFSLLLRISVLNLPNISEAGEALEGNVRGERGERREEQGE